MATQPPTELPVPDSQPADPGSPPPEIAPPGPDIDQPSPGTVGDPGSLATRGDLIHDGHQ